MSHDPYQALDQARRRLYAREEELLKRVQGGEDTPELQKELAAVREAIRRHLRLEAGFDDEADDQGAP